MTQPQRVSGPGILLVLDGWGEAAPGPANALSAAGTPVLDSLRAGHPSGLLAASGEAVGLLPGTVGNSEIGHMVIGAGRPLPYDSLLVQQEIDGGGLRRNALLTGAGDVIASTGRALHLIGLCSDGQIHADIEHLSELLAVAAEAGVPRVWIHAITDGRDVADGTAESYLRRAQHLAERAGVGRIATVTGRGYALDKAGNLDVTREAVLAVADGTGPGVKSPEEAVRSSERGDEWVPPSVVLGPDGDALAPIRDGDAVLFFNFRSDRIQQFADALLVHLAETGRTVTALSLAQYDTTAPIPPLVPRADASGGLADELAAAGLRSVRIAEAEKFEHVTYYVNGRSDVRREVEEHVRIKGEKAPDYRARPEMELGLVTAAVVTAAHRPEVDLVVANLANIDVVGHTGDFDATVGAAEATDAAVQEILISASQSGRWVILVGDHGNVELMSKPGPDGTDRPYGGHTTNPVPVVVVPAPGNPDGELRDDGTLADIAPTVLALLGRDAGAAMTGRPLL
ncbi:2,3-bisphosphoglycerate-independent phosphoglycerate mutase [Kitasatospora sp. NPDC093806]|uniref:2,3-bisphosphoglycerate-independent phosphoglycerate mutase n=1 Tax=Kitasatospora sp. NPDC093806 TaxID=3155075 RepID=UPI003447E819